MGFQLTSLRYSQGAPGMKQTHFNWKFEEDEISAQDRICQTIFLKFEHSDLAISEVSHYEFLKGHFLIR
jgi:dUTPase